MNFLRCLTKYILGPLVSIKTRRIPIRLPIWQITRDLCSWPLLVPKNFILALYDGATLRFIKRDKSGIENLGTIQIFDDQWDVAAGKSINDKLKQIRLPVFLRLAENLGIKTFDHLPRAARKDLHKILANRLDRITPWSPEEAICEPLSVVESASDGMIDISLLIVPKHKINEATDALGRLGQFPDLIDFEGADPFAPPKYSLIRNNASSQSLTYAFIAIGITIIFFVNIVTFIDLLNQKKTTVDLQIYLDNLIRNVADLPQIYREYTMLQAESNAILEQIHGQPTALTVIEKLSEVLPETSWLESLTLDNGQMTIAGYSVEVSRIPALLEGHPAFMNVAFAAPTQTHLWKKEQGDGKEIERFSLRFSVVREVEQTP